MLLASLAACGFGLALALTSLGLRRGSPALGARTSIPSATLLFLAAAPFLLDTAGWTPAALAFFAAVGTFFPAGVTLLVFAANDRVGPARTAAASATTPAFAVAAAVLFLGESLDARTGSGTLAIVAGVGALALRRGARPQKSHALGVALALLAAALRGVAQAAIAFGLALWPNPFAAALIGYCASTCTVIALERAGPRGSRRGGLGWFALAGICNGLAVLALYHALRHGSVGLVAPLVAAHPLLALAASYALRSEVPDRAAVLGAVLTVAGLVLLVV